ncbi:antibiotic biosynthesis monooxygenase [Diplodia corticola]|uniref:Antibiotic biosynthesis monooxygenase n=1 Tax=Diplodia corticola TaxID=236234 RepID=A0A1J9RQS9_9PEZI|nr:antibiotic biosynthesis monooxygenase [Diplodia corticola]OJD30799.1 antibiotic biosynthesis monooxygenase [Diplodia corticola]
MAKICTWTEFRVPESEPIFEINNHYAPSEARQKWINVIAPLAEATGFEVACWSRIKERPDTIALCARWASREALQSFRVSPEHAAYMQGISAFGPPLELGFDSMGSSIIYLTNHPWVSLLRIVFPHPLSAERRKKVRMLNGLIGSGGRGPLTQYDLPWFESHITWACGDPWTKTERDEEEKEANGTEGTNETTLFWFHSWRSFDHEDEYKRTYTKRFYREETGTQQLPPEEWFDKSVRELGAVEWSQEHYFGFKYVPRVFNGEPSCGRFVRNGKIIAGGTVLER